MANNADAVLRTFSYKGVPFYALSSIMDIKDYQQQIDEINSRMQALIAHCAANNYTLTETHMRVVLGRISQSSFSRILRGMVPNGNQTWVKADLSNRLTDEEKRLVEQRAEVLQGWKDCGEVMWADGVSNDKYPTGKIFLGKVYFNKRENGKDDDKKLGLESLVERKRRKAK